MRVASASSRCVTSAVGLSRPVVSSKSRPVATDFPAASVRVESMEISSPALASRAERSQYSELRKARRSISRSVSIRTATLCTRPADRPLLIFFHSSGDSV